MNDNATAGPALRAAAVPVRTKMPVPMMAPIPSMTRSSPVRERFSPFSLSASAQSSWIDFVAKIPRALMGSSLTLAQTPTGTLRTHAEKPAARAGGGCTG